MTIPNSELNAVLAAARTAPKILAALSRVEWRRTHPGADCPDDAIASLDAIYEWLIATVPPTTQHKVRKRLGALVPWLSGSDRPEPDPDEVTIRDTPAWLALREANELLTEVLRRGGRIEPGQQARWDVPAEAIPIDSRDGTPLEVVHAIRLEIPEADRPRHPFAPLVAAWQFRTSESRADAALAKLVREIDPGQPAPTWAEFSTWDFGTGTLDAMGETFQAEIVGLIRTGFACDVDRTRMLLAWDVALASSKRGDDDDGLTVFLALFDVWELIPIGKRPAFPYTALVRQWIVDRAPSAPPNRKESGIVPAPFVAMVKRDEQAELPGFDVAMPGPVFTGGGEQAYLPGMEPEGEAMPALLLALYDEAGGLGRTSGPGATHAMHLFVESLLSVPVEARTGSLYRVGGENRPLTVGEVAGEWMQWNPKHYRAAGKRTGILLRQAWRHVRDIAMPLNKRGGFYFPVLFEAATGWRWNDRLALLVRIPPEGKVGAAVNRSILRYLRTKSEPAYRGYLSLSLEWNRYGATSNPKAKVGHKHRLILPTRPVALRNERGELLMPLMERDGKGKPTDRRVLDEHGRPMGDPARVITGTGGIPVKSPYDPRATLTGDREPNPARDRYPPRGADDLVRLCYPLKVFDDPNVRRRMYSEARQAIELVEKVGGCTIERLGNHPRDGCLPWRIMPPDVQPGGL